MRKEMASFTDAPHVVREELPTFEYGAPLYYDPLPNWEGRGATKLTIGEVAPNSGSEALETSSDARQSYGLGGCPGKKRFSLN